MALNLKKFLQEAYTQANPFDNGKTAATVRASYQKPPPAQTVSRGGGTLSVGVANPQQRIVTNAPAPVMPRVSVAAPYQLPRLNVGVAQPQNLRVGNTSIAPSPTLNTDFDSSQNQVYKSPSLISQIKQFGPSALGNTLTNPQAWDSAPKVNVGSFKGSGVIEDFANSPFRQGKGLVQLGQGQVKQGLGNTIAGTLEGPLSLIPFGKAVEAGAKVTTGLLPKVLVGARVGAKQGVGYGGVYAGADTASRNGSVADIAKATTIGSTVGGLSGGLLGGATPLVAPTTRLIGRGVVNASEKLGQSGSAEIGGPLLPIPGKRLPQSIAPEAQQVLESNGVRVSMPPAKPPTKPALQVAGGGPPIKKTTTGALEEIPKGKQTKFASKTVPESPYVSAGVKEKLDSPKYNQNTEKQAYAESGRRYQEVGEEQFFTNSENALDKPNGTITRQEAIDAQTTAQLLDARGDDASLRRAADIYDKLSEHYTAAGQTVQAAAIMARRSPQGLMYHAQNVLKKAGVELNPQLRSELLAQIEKIKKMKPGTKREYEVNRLLDKVDKNIPSELADKITSTWKAGLLTGIKTQTGNFLSNATFGVLHDVSNPLAAGIDKLISLGTGQRTKTLTGKGRVGGTVEGLGHAGRYLKTGIDERAAAIGKYEGGGVKFKSKFLNTYVNGVFKLMGAADRPAYYSQLRNSLYDLGAAQAKNKGLTGTERTKFIKDFVNNPPDVHAQTAIDEANKAVLNYDTIASKVMAGIAQKLNQIPATGKVGKFAAKLAIGFNAPFVRVPSAFLSRTLDFTALGVPKEVLRQISQGKFDQRALSTAIAEAGTGTALLATGVALAGKNLLTGDYPSDPKEQARWKTHQIQPNSVKLGNEYLSLNYMGPVGIIFSAANKIDKARKEGSNFIGQAGTAVAGIPKSFLQQSFVQGLNNAAQAVDDPGRYAAKYINQMAGSVVPTISKDIAEANDTMQRKVSSATDAIKARIPKVRKSLPADQDVYGNDLKRKTGPISTAANPLRPSDAITNDVTSEVDRLHNVDTNNTDLQVTPTPIDKVFKESGTATNLNDNQVRELQKLIGQKTQKTWGDYIKTDEYKGMGDLEKAAALNKIRQGVTANAKREYAAKYGLGQYSQDFNGKADRPTTYESSLSSGSVSATIPKKTPTKTTSKAKVTPAKKLTVQKGSSTKSTARKSSYKLSDILGSDLRINKSLRQLLKEAKLK